MLTSLIENETIEIRLSNKILSRFAKEMFNNSTDSCWELNPSVSPIP